MNASYFSSCLVSRVSRSSAAQASSSTGTFISSVPSQIHSFHPTSVLNNSIDASSVSFNFNSLSSQVTSDISSPLPYNLAVTSQASVSFNVSPYGGERERKSNFLFLSSLPLHPFISVQRVPLLLHLSQSRVSRCVVCSICLTMQNLC